MPKSKKLKATGQELGLRVASWRDAVATGTTGLLREQQRLAKEFPEQPKKQVFKQRDVAKAWFQALASLYQDVADYSQDYSVLSFEKAKNGGEEVQKEWNNVTSQLEAALKHIKNIEITYPLQVVQRLRRYFASYNQLLEEVKSMKERTDRDIQSGKQTPSSDSLDITRLFTMDPQMETEIQRIMAYAITRKKEKDQVIGQSDIPDSVILGKRFR